MKQMRVRPLSGKKIRDPRDGRPLPADRTTVVPCTSYWQRRLNDKDIEVVANAKQNAKPHPLKSEKTEKKEEKKEKTQ